MTHTIRSRQNKCIPICQTMNAVIVHMPLIVPLGFVNQIQPLVLHQKRLQIRNILFRCYVWIWIECGISFWTCIWGLECVLYLLVHYYPSDELVLCDVHVPIMSCVEILYESCIGQL